MFSKTIYLGYHPLGGNLEINGIKIMQKEWTRLCKPIIFPLKMPGGQAFFCEPYYVESDGKRAFFLATERGIGKYHIYGFSERAVEKLNNCKKLK